MNEHIETNRTTLEAERDRLHSELAQIAVEVDPERGIWEAHASTLDVSPADPNEVADASEESSENRAFVAELGVRYRNVLRALEKIEQGTYGICEISGEQIEADRLEANPAARTCKAHMEDESKLES